MIRRCDQDEVNYQNRIGEFSDNTELAFDKHLHRLHMKVNGLISYEPMWFEGYYHHTQTRRYSTIWEMAEQIRA